MKRLVLCIGVLFALDASVATADVPPLDPLVLVLGLAANPAHRDKFEDALVGRLNAQGLRALASHPLIPTLHGASRESIGAVARDRHVTAVIAVVPVRVAPSGTITTNAPLELERNDQLDALLRAALAVRDAAGRVALVTNVVQVGTGRLVWGGVSWSFELNDVDTIIDETSSLIADNIIAAQRQLERLRAKGIDPLAEP